MSLDTTDRPWTAKLIAEATPEDSVPEVECSDELVCGCRNCDASCFFYSVRAYAKLSPRHRQLLFDALTDLRHGDGLTVLSMPYPSVWDNA